jgi:prophage regulatory protein
MRLYRYPDLKPRGIPWTNKHLITLEKRGDFPRRVQLGSNTVAWVADEVDGYVADRVSAREVA